MKSLWIKTNCSLHRSKVHKAVFSIVALEQQQLEINLEYNIH